MKSKRTCTIIAKPLPKNTILQIHGDLICTCALNIQSLTVTGNTFFRDSFTADELTCFGDLTANKELDIASCIILCNCKLLNESSFVDLSVKHSIVNYGDLSAKTLSSDLNLINYGTILSDEISIKNKLFSLGNITSDILSAGSCNALIDCLVINKTITISGKMCLRSKASFLKKKKMLAKLKK